MMAITKTLESSDYDFVIVGGGTAGCVLASRLSEYLPENQTLLIEGGPSDFGLREVEEMKNSIHLIGGELDYDYPIEPQINGNSHIRYSRAKVLGGCSSHNGGISVHPFEYDLRVWESLGCKGWSFPLMQRLIAQLRTVYQPVDVRNHNTAVNAWIQSCSNAMKVPVVGDLNCEIVKTGNPVGAVGYLPIAYNVEDGSRYSSSTSYIHPILKGEWKRPNLTILTNARVNRVNIEDSRVVGVNLTLESGRKSDVRAVEETILCAGAVDTPGLLLRSGVGPRKQLEDLSIPVHADIPGVGENLQDHPEAIVVWELEKEMPPETATFCDAYLLMRREAENARGNDGQTADLYFHMFTTAWDINLRRLGYTIPKNSFSMAPNIPRPRSRGRIFLTSKDEKAAPAIDFRYFTDLEGYDEATVIAGIKACRRVASTAPFKDWIKREIAPGPQITTDEAIGEFGRRAANTLYHASCTTKMGDLKRDPFAVVDSELKVRDLKGVRIADAGVFPVITSINPMLTVLAIGERAAELIALERGWKPSDTVIDATVHGATGTTYMKT